MRVDMHKNFDKDVFHTIETAMDYPPKSVWDKIRPVLLCKLTQITKFFIISGRLGLPLT